MIQQLSGIMMMICFAGCYIPQIHKIIKTKKAKDLSLGLIAMSAFGSVFGLIYASFNSNNCWFIISYIIGLSMTVILTYLQLKYSK